MVKNKKLAKHISDCGWSEFTRQLEYKAGWRGRKVVKVGRFFPSSKMCRVCGEVNKDLTLADRKWTCVNGHELNRDYNAAKNILKEGLNSLSATDVDYSCGEKVRPKKACRPRRSSAKQLVTNETKVNGLIINDS